jgi:hypothetical protein
MRKARPPFPGGRLSLSNGVGSSFSDEMHGFFAFYGATSGYHNLNSLLGLEIALLKQQSKRQIIEFGMHQVPYEYRSTRRFGSYHQIL